MQFFGHRYVYGKPRGAGTKCSKKFRSGTTSGMSRRQVLGPNRWSGSSFLPEGHTPEGAVAFKIFMHAHTLYTCVLLMYRCNPHTPCIVHYPLKSNRLPRPRQSNDDIFQQCGITIAVIFVPIKKGMHKFMLDTLGLCEHPMFGILPKPSRYFSLL